MYLLNMLNKKLKLPAPGEALPGRANPIATAAAHHVSGRPLQGPYPEGFRIATVAMGCFWGAEKRFWSLPGVYITAVGYCAGLTPNPTYQEVCTGLTGHTEAVRIVYDPAEISLEALLKIFWESHNPTEGMRQGNDVGTQYRSGIYLGDAADLAAAEASRIAYQAALTAAGRGSITTEIREAGPFYFAEEFHQQYLAKNPAGYCGLGGTGVACPIGTGAAMKL